jgi:hypothetical protein
LQFGREFRESLDARDQVMEHEFEFEFDLSMEHQRWLEGETFLKSNLHEAVKQQLKKFLVEAASNVVSTAFRHLCKGDLEEKEAKEYAVKNITLNLHSAYQRTVCALKQHPQTKGRVKEGEWAVFISELDSILAHILSNLADLYPMATPSGGTLRMRNIIHEVNRVDDEENDFIYCNNIKISDYLTLGDLHLNNTDNSQGREIQFSEEGDYTEFIMKVINTIIEVPQDNCQDARERTVFEKFTLFSEHLFWAAQQKPYQMAIEEIEKKSS